LAIKYNINSEINIDIKEKNFNKQLKDVYVAFSLLFKDINTKNVYFKKNEINYKRIANNY